MLTAVSRAHAEEERLDHLQDGRDAAWLSKNLRRFVAEVHAEQRRKAAALLRRYHWLADDPLSFSYDVLVPFSESRREVRHTQLLGHFINPAGAAGLAGLRALCKLLFDRLGLSFSASSLAGAVVRCELSREIEDGRASQPTVDLSIDFPALRRTILIEAKVDASERDGQLQDYERLAKRGPFRTHYFFLTLDGRAAVTAGREAWVPLRWVDVAAAMRAALHTIPSSPGRHYLSMWISSILHSWYDVPIITKRLTGREGRGLEALNDFLETYARSIR